MFQSLFDVFEDEVYIAFIICVVCSLVMAVLTSLVYSFAKRKVGYARGMPICLIVLPVAATMIVSLVNLRLNELTSLGVGAGLMLAGIFALTRFRSENLTVEDLCYVFLASAIGISMGLGYVAYSVLGLVLILMAVVIISFTNIGRTTNRDRRMKILVPEDLNYEETFNAILKEYCTYVHLEKVKTVDFGQLFELTYVVKLKKGASEKQLMDEIRVKNGNLEVALLSREM